MAITLYRVAGDSGGSVTLDLLSGGIAYNLANQTLVCYLRNTDGSLAQTVTDVTLRNQLATPGRCTTTFTEAQLVEGTYTMEWHVAAGDLTFPGKRVDRPFLVVRSATT